MKAKDKSFSSRLSSNIVLATSIIFIIALGIVAVSSYVIISEQAKNYAMETLQKTILEVESRMNVVETNIHGAQWLIREKYKDEDYLYHITTKLVQESPNVVGSAVAFKDGFYKGRHFFSPYSYKTKEGEIGTKQLGNEDYDYFDMDWFRIPFETGKPYWTDPYFDEGGADILMCTYSYPAFNEDGEVVAVITADITLEWISRIIRGIHPYEHSAIVMLTKDGTYIGQDKAGINISELPTYYDENKELMRKEMLEGKSGFQHFYLSKNLPAFGVYAPLDNGWSASLICAYSDVLKPATLMQLILSLIALVGLTILFLICYFTIRKLTRPLKDVTVAAKVIAGGNFKTDLPPVKYNDEIKQLRDSFDDMQKSLVSYINNLREATEAKQKIESELGIARGIQLNMVPHNFPTEGPVDIHAVLEPAKEVGGDLYDFYMKGHYLYFVIGDVSGKGVPGAMFMAITRSAFRFISGMDLGVSEITKQINNFVCNGNTSAMFVTMFIGKIDLKTGDFTYCNAGHNPILINSRFLHAKSNLAIGLIQDFPYEEEHMKLDGPTHLILYTDGVTEAETADKDQFGEERLEGWSKGIDKSINAEQACNSLLNSVRAFTNGAEQNDDITIMTISIQ
ncbi:MAG: SpoIIE family protein phosphatase [Bacteroidales bacterium]|nr:SpoIIE family protein phosphatase [Bacteroidales bacterium]